MAELRAHKVKRLQMRSMRRGIKEMDLILSRFAGASLDTMTDADLARYDALLNENDHDLYHWVSGQSAPPDRFEDMLNRIKNQLPAL